MTKSFIIVILVLLGLHTVQLFFNNILFSKMRENSSRIQLLELQLNNLQKSLVSIEEEVVFG